MQFLVFTASSSLTISSVVHTASSEIRKWPEKVVAVLSRSLTKGGRLQASLETQGQIVGAREGLNWRKNRPLLFSAPFFSCPFRLTPSALGSPRTVCEMSNTFVFWLDGRLIKGEVVKHGGFTVLLQTIQNDFYVSDPNSSQYELSKAQLQLPASWATGARYIWVVKETNLSQYADCFSINAGPDVSKSPLFFTECRVLPSSLSNGIVYGSGNVEGVVYRFSCHDGYALVGSEILYCRENGHWNASVPSCLRGLSSFLFCYVESMQRSLDKTFKPSRVSIYDTVKFRKYAPFLIRSFMQV